MILFSSFWVTSSCDKERFFDNFLVESFVSLEPFSFPPSSLSLISALNFGFSSMLSLPSRIGRRQSSSSLICSSSTWTSPLLELFPEIPFFLSDEAPIVEFVFSSLTDLVLIEEVTSHQIVELSFLIRQMLQVGANGRGLPPDKSKNHINKKFDENSGGKM